MYSDEELTLTALDSLRLAASKVTANEAAVAQATALAQAALKAAKEAQAYANASRKERKKKGHKSFLRAEKREDCVNRGESSKLSSASGTTIVDAEINLGGRTKRSTQLKSTAPAAFRKVLEKVKSRKVQEVVKSTSSPVRKRASRKHRGLTVEDEKLMTKIEDVLTKLHLEELAGDAEPPGNNFKHEAVTNVELRKGKLLTAEEEVLLAQGVQVEIPLLIPLWFSSSVLFL